MMESKCMRISYVPWRFTFSPPVSKFRQALHALPVTMKVESAEMGRGGGCFPSTSRKHVLKVDSPKGPSSKPSETTPETLPSSDTHDKHGEVQTRDGPVSSEDINTSPAIPPEKKIRIFIVFYSMYGGVEALAKKMKEGVDSIEGIEGSLFRVPETLSAHVLEEMHAPKKDESIPLISASELPAADGIIFGFPTRFGAMAAQMKAFFDSTGQLWKEQSLAGKPGAFFVSTGTQGGGQETTA
eukprot:Gb_05511 [translate_table: standard]